MHHHNFDSWLIGLKVVVFLKEIHWKFANFSFSNVNISLLIYSFLTVNWIYLGCEQKETFEDIILSETLIDILEIANSACQHWCPFTHLHTFWSVQRKYCGSILCFTMKMCFGGLLLSFTGQTNTDVWKKEALSSLYLYLKDKGVKIVAQNTTHGCCWVRPPCPVRIARVQIHFVHSYIVYKQKTEP